jgi:hypothetical protein
MPTESHSNGQRASYFPRTLRTLLLSLGNGQPLLIVRNPRLLQGNTYQWHVQVVLKPIRIIRKCAGANCISFHLRVFLGLSNPQVQRQTSTLSILCDNFGERKAKFNLETNRTIEMQLYKCIHIP